MKPSNPPAFPAYVDGLKEGMTLRDYFAAKALQGWLSSLADADGVPSPDGISEYAYRVADAMLAQREKETP